MSVELCTFLLSDQQNRKGRKDWIFRGETQNFRVKENTDIKVEM